MLLLLLYIIVGISLRVFLGVLAHSNIGRLRWTQKSLLLLVVFLSSSSSFLCVCVCWCWCWCVCVCVCGGGGGAYVSFCFCWVSSGSVLLNLLLFYFIYWTDMQWDALIFPQSRTAHAGKATDLNRSQSWQWGRGQLWARAVLTSCSGTCAAPLPASERCTSPSPAPTAGWSTAWGPHVRWVREKLGQSPERAAESARWPAPSWWWTEAPVAVRRSANPSLNWPRGNWIQITIDNH